MGFEPSSLGEHSTNWASRSTQLVGVRIYSTTQHKAVQYYTNQLSVYLQPATLVSLNRVPRLPWISKRRAWDWRHTLRHCKTPIREQAGSSRVRHELHYRRLGTVSLMANVQVYSMPETSYMRSMGLESGVSRWTRWQSWWSTCGGLSCSRSLLPSLTSDQREGHRSGTVWQVPCSCSHISRVGTSTIL